MSKIGYIHVSAEHQETARQLQIMDSYQVDRICSEKLSGAITDRPQFRAMPDYVKEGDELCIESITGRDFMWKMGLSANTFYRRVRKYEATHGTGEPSILHQEIIVRCFALNNNYYDHSSSPDSRNPLTAVNLSGRSGISTDAQTAGSAAL